jgi:hypothetical protein
MPELDGVGITEIEEIPTKTYINANASVIDFGENLEHTLVEPGSFELEYARGQVNAPEMYIPHLGSLYKYWLVDFQTAIRPLGFGKSFNLGAGEPTYEPNTPPTSSENCTGGSGVYRCNQYTHLTTGYCSVDNLERTFLEVNPNDPLAHDKACLASKICNRESGGRPGALNTGCITGRTCDYSAGLFQYNFIIPSRCPGGMLDYSCNPDVWCTVDNQATLDACVQEQFNPDTAIQTMLRLSNNGVNWCPWQIRSPCVICDY